ncbi:MAG: hypothetical protein ACMG6S_26140, partial [Byssovorax sp.]
MSFWDPVVKVVDDGVDAVEDVGDDVVNATVSVADDVADGIVDVGNTLVSTGNTLYNTVADGAVATFQTASGGVVYAIDWTETEAAQIASYAVSASGDIGHFSVDLLGKAESWAEDAWKYLSSYLMSSPPSLGDYDDDARDVMKAVLVSYVKSTAAAEVILTTWEREAVKKD